MKPSSDAPYVQIRPIPKSEYSIRLFPGNYRSREWGLDFVRSDTGKPVNSPFKFELFVIPNPKRAWLEPGVGGILQSFERRFRIAQENIRPGEEKWILQDGQTCLLRRPGMKDVAFTVPIRPLPEPEVDTRSGEPDVDWIDLPEVLSPVNDVE